MNPLHFFWQNASFAVFISRKTSLTIGDIILLFNIIIFGFAAYVFTIEVSMYAMLTYLAASKTVDFVVSGIEEYMGVTIISEESEEMFNYIKGYSPVHNVKEGVSYPATLVTTGDHDDRVVPAHSFKFAAELQEKQSGENPTLIRIETNAGHGAGTPVSKTIEQYADIFGFTFFNMGYDQLPNQAVLKEFKD